MPKVMLEPVLLISCLHASILPPMDQGHAQGLKWEFVVINEPGTVNAFVMPGGKVVVYSGLLHLLRKEDEVAAVLGHEVAHVLARHIVSL